MTGDRIGAATQRTTPSCFLLPCMQLYAIFLYRIIMSVSSERYLGNYSQADRLLSFLLKKTRKHQYEDVMCFFFRIDRQTILLSTSLQKFTVVAWILLPAVGSCSRDMVENLMPGDWRTCNIWLVF